MIRKNKGLTQEALAERLQVSRQAVAKWETGQAYPDINNLIQISNLFHVTVDYLVKDQKCMVDCIGSTKLDYGKLIDFRLEANMNTYAAYMNETQSTRLDSHDYTYSSGPYTYHDTYVGGEQFAGEEAIWHQSKAAYAMNYTGRVLNQYLSRDFLKEALRHADRNSTNPENICINAAVWSAIFPGFKAMRKSASMRPGSMNAIFHGGIMK